MYYVIVYLRSQIYSVEAIMDKEKAKNSELFWRTKLNADGSPRYIVILAKKVD